MALGRLPAHGHLEGQAAGRLEKAGGGCRVRGPNIAEATGLQAPFAAAGPVLAARGIHKRFGHGAAAVWALRGCDLALERGRIVALMGPSGSGKATLLHIVSG